MLKSIIKYVIITFLVLVTNLVAVTGITSAFSMSSDLFNIGGLALLLCLVVFDIQMIGSGIIRFRSYLKDREDGNQN